MGTKNYSYIPVPQDNSAFYPEDTPAYTPGSNPGGFVPINMNGGISPQNNLFDPAAVLPEGFLPKGIMNSFTGGNSLGSFPELTGIDLSTIPDKKIIGGSSGVGGNDWLDPKGAGGMALGSVQSLGNLYLGMKGYGLAKDTFEHNKAMSEKNYAANKQLTNANLSDRQKARVASNPGGYESVGSYMSTNGVK
jgi:hypothetical protein